CLFDKAVINFRRSFVLWPYCPVAFSSTYSRTFVRTRGGNCRTASIRLMTLAERPLPLWVLLRRVQAVLRHTPRILACASIVGKPAEINASAISRIFADCRAFTFATDCEPTA